MSSHTETSGRHTASTTRWSSRALHWPSHLGYVPSSRCSHYYHFSVGPIALLHEVPLDAGFNLVSILSSVQPQRRTALAGASLSGKLKSQCRLVLRPTRRDGKAGNEYLVVPTQRKSVCAELEKSTLYHRETVEGEDMLCLTNV